MLIEKHETAWVADDAQLLVDKATSKIIIGPNCKIRGKWHLLGENQRVEFGAGTIINGSPICILAEEGDEISFGEGCLMASPLFRTSDGHGIYSVATGKRLNVALPIRIGARNWLGDRAIILRGVETGADTVIGAGAVVNRIAGGYPPNVALSGAPATISATGIVWRHHTKPEIEAG